MGNITGPSTAVIGDCEHKTRARFSVRSMAKNTPPPHCPKCGKPMRFVLVKTGGRRFRCLDCDGEDPLKSPDVARLLEGSLRPTDRPE
jgi:tRNA(Ile2) C34 agmatinyltransferase TiaS